MTIGLTSEHTLTTHYLSLNRTHVFGFARAADFTHVLNFLVAELLTGLLLLLA